jgi:transposase-like protein
VETTVQRVLEWEITEHLQAGPHERMDARRGHRNGYTPCQLKTRVKTLERRVLHDREGTFKTEVFDRYQRSETVLVVGLMEICLEGISTRKVTEVTEALCGTAFSKSP